MNEIAVSAAAPLLIFLWIFGIFVAVFVIFWIFARLKKRATQKYALNLIFLRVLITKKVSDADRQRETVKDWKEAISVAKQFFRSLHMMRSSSWGSKFFGRKFLSFEITAQNGEIYFHVAVPRDLSEFIEKQITSYYPDAAIDEVEVPQIFSDSSFIQSSVMTFAKDSYFPLRSYQKMDSDPLNNVVNALSKVAKEEGAAVQILISPTDDSWAKKGKTAAKKLFAGKKEKKSMVSNIVFGGSKDGEKPEEPKRLTAHEEENVKAIEEKCSDFGFETIIRIISAEPSDMLAKANLQNIESAFGQFSDPESNSLKSVSPDSWFRRKILHSSLMKDYIFRFFTKTGKPMILNSEELAGIFHFPNILYNQSTAIKWQNFKIVAAPAGLPKDGVLIGHNHYHGEKTEVRLSTEDRFRHFYIIGQTGTGKSTVLQSMIIQDILNGEGVCVMDPHGDLADTIIDYIPKERADDIIYFNPSDTSRPLGLNLLETPSGTEEEKDFVANDALQMMIKLYGEEVFVPRLQDYFRNGVLTLMDDDEEGGTLVDIMTLFTNDSFQKRKRAKVKNPIVRDWWDNKFDKMGDTEKNEIIPYFQSKFTAFSTNAMMRNIVGQTKSAFDFFEAMNSKKVILVNLSKATLGEFNSNLIGMMIVSKIQMAAFRRGTLPPEERKDFFFYIDEFQNFVTPSIASILAEARKYRLSLNLAHQYISQLESSGGLAGPANDQVKNAVFGNVGSLASLKVSSTDAEYLAHEFSPDFSEYDLNNFDVFKGVIKMSVNKQQTKPFSFEALKYFKVPEWKPDKKVSEAIKQLSRLKYGRDREFVNEEIIGRLK